VFIYLFLAYSTTLSMSKIMCRQMVGRFVNNELGFAGRD
jgi:hypothetical protein